ncbi:MAG TPA: hypothetical protein VLJ59_14505, partial [Mycobacteriales bacterium]|nr:hypothetical protein [Mycobacteriales bacterium]
MSGLVQPFEDVLDQHDHLIIEGSAGLGKTTLGHRLAARLVDVLLDPTNRLPSHGVCLPLVVPARALAAHVHRTWGEALEASVASEYGMLADGRVSARLFSEAVAGLRWLVVVDALDEIPERGDRERLLTALAVRMSTIESPVRFMITTRPLSPGEITRLQGPRVGFYELQPWDQEALRRFADRWFDPDDTPAGAVAASEFLDQIRLAGLGPIVRVPLLATVAAHVHQLRRGRPLPASRYELYEDYIGYFTHARARGGSDVSDTLGQVPHTANLVGWLEEHRAELLEGLATAYTTSEDPLLEIAQRIVMDRVRMPDSLPSGWEDTLADWLCGTGLLARRGRWLRFLHQTFAEHLAATMRARALPQKFNPEHPQWDELISSSLLEDESAGRVLLHYLHLHGPSSDLLTWLQQGSRAGFRAAGRLVVQGAPCDDAQIDAHMTQVEDKVITGIWTDQDLALGGLTRHETVRSRLHTLLGLDDVGPRAKVRVVGLLHEHLPDVRRDGIMLLHRLVADSQPADLRREAAEVLARLGDEHHARAGVVLFELAVDPVAEARDRRLAAEELAKLGGGHRDRAAEALQQLATDTMVDAFDRREAAQELAKLGDERRTQAAAVLRELAADPTVQALYRRVSALELAKLGGEHRSRAIEALHEMAVDPTTRPGDQVLALATSALVEPQRRQLAADALYELAVDPCVEGYLRRDAAQELAKLGSEARRRAADALNQMVLDSAFYAWERRPAALELAKLGSVHRSQAAEGLHQLAIDPTSDADDRRAAAQELAKLGGDHRA